MLWIKYTLIFIKATEVIQLRSGSDFLFISCFITIKDTRFIRLLSKCTDHASDKSLVVMRCLTGF